MLSLVLYEIRFIEKNKLFHLKIFNLIFSLQVFVKYLTKTELESGFWFLILVNNFVTKQCDFNWVLLFLTEQIFLQIKVNNKVNK